MFNLSTIVGFILYVTITESRQIENVILAVTQNYFSECNVILAFNRINGSQRFVEMISNIQLELSEKYLHDVYLINFDELTLKAEDKSWFQSSSSNSFIGLSKLRSNCILSIIFVEKYKLDTTNQLHQLLIPRTNEISKKDEDYYLIVTQNEIVSRRILYSKKFGMNLKYKMVLTDENIATTTNENIPNDGMDKIDVNVTKKLIKTLTMCFYCKPGKSNNEEILERNIGSEMLSLVSKNEFFVDHVKNFNGQKLRSVISSGLFNIARIKRNSSKPGGQHLIVFHHLAEVFNFTYEVKYGTGGGTGLKLPNGTWVGTAGDVINNIADVSVTTAVTYQRYPYLSFCYPSSWEWLTFTTPIPKTYLSSEAILWPFTMELWLCIFCGIIVTSFSLIFFNFILNRYKGYKIKYWTSLGFIFGSLFEESFDLPKNLALRIIITVWLIFGIIIGTAYKSKLVTALAFPVFSSPPNTFEELAFSGYKIGMCYIGGAAFAAFNSSVNPTYVKIANEWKLYTDFMECFKNSQSEGQACIGFDSMAEYSLASKLSDRKGRHLLRVSSASTFFVPAGIGVSKRAIYRTNWDKYLRQWDDMNLNVQWKLQDYEAFRRKKIERENKENIKGSEVEDDTGPSKLQFGNVKGIFMFLGIGSIIGIIFFLVETISVYFT